MSMMSFDLFGDFEKAFLERNAYCKAGKAADAADTSDKKEDCSCCGNCGESCKKDDGACNSDSGAVFNPFCFGGIGHPFENPFLDFLNDFIGKKVETNSKNEEQASGVTEEEKNEECKQEVAEPSAECDKPVEPEEEPFVTIVDRTAVFRFKIPAQFDEKTLFDISYDKSDLSFQISAKRTTDDEEMVYSLKKKISEKFYRPLNNMSVFSLCRSDINDLLDWTVSSAEYDPDKHVLTVSVPQKKEERGFGMFDRMYR